MYGLNRNRKIGSAEHHALIHDLYNHMSQGNPHLKAWLLESLTEYFDDIPPGSPHSIKPGHIPWKQMKHQLPEPERSYLIAATHGGPMLIYNVALYRGKQPDGTHRWILSNIDIDHITITHWAEIDEPQDFVK